VQIDKKIIVRMITGQQPDYWVRDWMGVNKLPSGQAVTQIILVKADDPEPFPGLTANMCKYLNSHEVVGVLGVMTDTDRKVVNLLIDEHGETDSGGAH